MLDMTLDQKLRTACRGRGWEVSQLRAQFPGKSKQTIYNWWNGQTKPDLDSALALSRLLGLPLEYLADDQVDELPRPELTDDDRLVLRVVRAHGLDVDEAIRRLSAVGGRAPTEGVAVIPGPSNHSARRPG